MLTIALFLAVRYAKTGRVIPRAAVYGGLLAANLAWRRRAAPATAAGADGAAGTGPRTVIYVVNATQQPSSDDGWNWSATAEPAPPEPRALATAAPPDDAGRPPGESGPGGVGPGPSGGGPAGGSGGSGASGPSASSRGTVSAGFPPQPRRGPTGGTPSNSMVSPPSCRQGRPLTASQGADGAWQVYRGSAEFGDDVPGHGQGPSDDQ
jgi:hypothetical protein